ncbi:MAG: D-alanine--D-alanine ligase [Oscillospiraceae bacterium]|nr:D-alanine--D-alanine ligase [Oscillospiraceae bacterium]
MKIVVLAGGISTERQVSLVSGTEMCKALRGLGHAAILVDLFLGLPGWEGRWDEAFSRADGFCSEVKVGRDAPSLRELRESRGGRSRIGEGVLKLCKCADLVFLGLHGADGEDGKIQAALDLLGVPYTGSGYLGSAMAMDKTVSKQLMKYHGIRTPDWQELTLCEEDIPRLAQELPLPCVVKTPNGGSSLGVLMPETREALEDALRQVAVMDPRVIVEQKITGREITVPVLGDRYLPAIEIVPPEGAYFDYVAKYQSGDQGGAREVCPAPITEAQFREMGEMALALHRALGLAVYSRADFILDEAGVPWCLETNTLPGMTPASLLPKSAAVAGLSYPALCQKIAELSLHCRR